MREDGFDAQRARIVRRAAGEAEPGARGGQRLEAERLERADRPDVPGIGDDEAAALVERSE
jgi:hypothetical protein